MRKVVVIFILIALAGCRSSKQSKSSSSELSDIQNSTMVTDIYSLSMANSESFFKETALITIDWTVFDTDKPIDPETGERPVKAKGTAKGEKKAEGGSNVNLSDSTKMSIQKEESRETKESSSANSTKEKKESTQIKQAAGLVWALIVLATVCLVGFCIWKNRSNN